MSSWEQCLADCALDGFHLAGFQGHTCGCLSQALRFELAELPMEDCNLPCRNDTEHNCGGKELQVSLYRTMLVDQRCEKVKIGDPGQFKQVMLASVSNLFSIKTLLPSDDTLDQGEIKEINLRLIIAADDVIIISEENSILVKNGI